MLTVCAANYHRSSEGILSLHGTIIAPAEGRAALNYINEQRMRRKRLMKLRRWYSNTPASIVIGLGSARALCLTRKLKFLRKISSDDYSETVSSLILA